jgi:hypothetical protein
LVDGGEKHLQRLASKLPQLEGKHASSEKAGS